MARDVIHSTTFNCDVNNALIVFNSAKSLFYTILKFVAYCTIKYPYKILV